MKNLSLWYGEKRAISDVTLDIASNAVTAIIGPSGCGKSTFIRCLNRMHELVPKTRIKGSVLLQGEDLYSSDHRSGNRPSPGRHGLPKIESVSDDVDWRKCRYWLAIKRSA